MVLEISIKSSLEECTFNISKMKLLFAVFFAIVLVVCVSSEELARGMYWSLFDFVWIICYLETERILFPA